MIYLTKYLGKFFVSRKDKTWKQKIKGKKIIVSSHVERYLIYEVQSDFFYIGQRGGR